MAFFAPSSNEVEKPARTACPDVSAVKFFPGGMNRPYRLRTPPRWVSVSE